ncbi:MAG: BrnT family toxin [Candidatus Omnitrophota bacterium]
MKYYRWNNEKNLKLKVQRGVSFEDVLLALENNRLLGDEKHPNSKAYAKQRILIVEIDSYAYLVPYVENKNEIFFKTVITSRKATMIYLGKEKNDDKAG